MKVLFTDFDGTLNSVGSIIYNNRMKLLGLTDVPSNQSFCPIACSNLEYILEECPDVQVVISSNWRKDKNLSALQEIFKNNHILPDRIIDTTPVSEDEDRTSEIQSWLKDHPEVINFVIIDDRGIDGLLDHQVKVDSRNGLSFTDAEKVIEMFGGKNEEV